MSLTRPIVGDLERYRDHLISAHYVGPDLIAMVDGQELPAFYLNAEAARAAGRRFVDDKLKAQEAA